MTEPDRITEESGGQHHAATTALVALGVVYGDIGTSPLYAFRACFAGEQGIPLNTANVLGVLSLVFWALFVVISIKYLLFVMRADNRGEGGILALMAVVAPRTSKRSRYVLVTMGIFGAALLYGDGMITPAISVLSAVEGLSVATPVLDPYVVPLAIGILAALFAVQRRGTGAIGAVFGPVTLVWFVSIALLGARWLAVAPEVLFAVSPAYAWQFFRTNGAAAFPVVGAVFLVVTGGEALYADMGHFGRVPIRRAWFAVVLPALLLNYFGQGALLLHDPGAIENPFYLLAPGWLLLPLVALATLATVIASQAVITGAFSLTRQALRLGYLPRLEVRHSSEETIGQVYVPFVNWALLLATVALVLGFRSSANLAGAYGVAVSTTMVITTILAGVCAVRLWSWSVPAAIAVAVGFLVVDLAFFSANLAKVRQGGWVPLLVAAVVYVGMTTWRRGRAILAERMRGGTIAVASFVEDLDSHSIVRVPGTAVVMDGAGWGVPRTLLHNIKLNRSLHERVLIVTVVTEEVPRVRPGDRLEVNEYRPDIIRITAHFGFMETPNITRVLMLARRAGVPCDPAEATFLLGRETLVVTRRPGMWRWRKWLFALMSRNAMRATSHFGIPPNRVFEIGQQVEL